MKVTNVFVSFLVFSICTNSFFCAASEELDAVLDTDGEKLQAGVNYYILPVMRGSGGGLRFATFGPEICPFSVAQTRYEVEYGFTLTFTPAYDNDGLIRVSTDVNIIFFASTSCLESNLWNLHYDESIGKFIINTNGVVGNPGLQTNSNWFWIEKYGDDYKLVYCPKVCDFFIFICQDVGIFIQEDLFKNEKRRLALSHDEPFRVMFKKASNSSSF